MYFRFCKRSAIQTYTRVSHDLVYKSYVGLQEMCSVFFRIFATTETNGQI